MGSCPGSSPASSGRVGAHSGDPDCDPIRCDVSVAIKVNNKSLAHMFGFLSSDWCRGVNSGVFGTMSVLTQVAVRHTHSRLCPGLIPNLPARQLAGAAVQLRDRTKRS